MPTDLVITIVLVTLVAGFVGYEIGCYSTKKKIKRMIAQEINKKRKLK